MSQPIRFIAIVSVILLLAMLRFALIDLSNFAPIAAAGIFAIYFFRKKALGIPFAIGALFLSDLVIHMSNGNGLYQARIFDYFALGLGLAVAYLLIRKKNNVLPTMFATALGSLVFFIVSNFGVWIGSGLYPQNLSGLLLSYEMGIPFYWGTLIGDLFFTAVFIGGFELLSKQIPQLSIQSA